MQGLLTVAKIMLVAWAFNTLLGGPLTKWIVDNIVVKKLGFSVLAAHIFLYGVALIILIILFKPIRGLLMKFGRILHIC